MLDFVEPALLFTLGGRINTWPALFNLIPFRALDGAKILKWNKSIWLVSIAVAVGLDIVEALQVNYSYDTAIPL